MIKLLEGTQGIGVILAPTVKVAEAIIETAKKEHCDLIMLGSHGRRGVDRLLLGSDAEQVARIAPVPVMLVRQPPSAATTSQPPGWGGTAA